MQNHSPRLLHLELHWHRFLHQPVDPRLVAIIRIGLATLVLLNFGFAFPHVAAWWGEQGWLPLAASRELVDPDTWTIFLVLPKTGKVLWTCYALALTHAGLLLVGLFSRFNAIATFFWLVSFQHRNHLILDGEDTVMRLVAFFLIFMPLSDKFSLDARFWPKERQRTPSGWAVRLLQFQVCLVVFCAGLEKLGGEMWWNGEAMYYVTKLDDFFEPRYLPQRLLESSSALSAITYTTLVVELVAPILVWFRETRRLALVALVFLHLGMLLTMNLFLFQPLMLVAWLSHARFGEVVWIGNVFFRDPLRYLFSFLVQARAPDASDATRA